MTLRASRDALRSGGWLVFETRDPACRAWEQWTPDLTRRSVVVPGVGEVESWEEVTDVSGQLVTFRSLTALRRDDHVIESVSTLRFRSRAELEASLVDAGFQVSEVRDAPVRPGRESVFIAVRSAGGEPR